MSSKVLKNSGKKKKKKSKKKKKEEKKSEGLRLLITSLHKEILELKVEFVEDNEEMSKLLEEEFELEGSGVKQIDAVYESLKQCQNLKVLVYSKVKESEDEPKKREINIF